MLPDPTELAAEEDLLREPLYQAARLEVLEFVDRLQCATSVEEFVLLHRDLLIQFGARQDAAGEVLPAAKARTQAEIAELARADPKPVSALQAKQQKGRHRAGEGL